VARRVHLENVRAGATVALDPRQAHHLRDVLRLADGATVEVFDDSGQVGEGMLFLQDGNVSVRIHRAEALRQVPTLQLNIAAAVPKGDRADWMVEKLSELGVHAFIPLAAARSVVLPEGKSKRDRWNRIATEAAKQSRRRGVMRITELTDVAAALQSSRYRWFLSTEQPDAAPIAEAAALLAPGAALTAFVGPEGGWTDAERQQFLAAGAKPVRLTETILRVETAAVATAAVLLTLATRAAPAPLDAPAARDDDPAPTSAPDPA
jgi:16S rRNA (uracil1498-N3)-methyltransferase